jgi:oligopeptide/dipeptide ABC transporter ATP-binding protein
MSVVAGAPVLAVQDLGVRFQRDDGLTSWAVNGVSFEVAAGECVGLVGESGSGKSVTATAVLGLLSPRGSEVDGSIQFCGRDLLTASERELVALRGTEIALVPQDSLGALNPMMRVGRQIAEVLRRKRGLGRAEAGSRAIELLDEMGIPNPAQRSRQYPHQLSGGLRQRVCLAVSLAGDPSLLIADEPTTALDATVERRVLDLLDRERRERQMAVLLISHDLGVVRHRCSQLVVMYGGMVMEAGPTERVLGDPQHPYTRALLACAPSLSRPAGTVRAAIPGEPRQLFDRPSACPFAGRCSLETSACTESRPPLQREGRSQLTCIHADLRERDRVC